MNKSIIAIALCFFAAFASASDEPIRVKYNGSRGWDFSSPLYRSTTNQTQSKVRYYENLPKKEVKQAFRDLDRNLNRNINRSLKKLFR